MEFQWRGIKTVQHFLTTLNNRNSDDGANKTDDGGTRLLIIIAD
jgi:hypothetical protein